MSSAVQAAGREVAVVELDEDAGFALDWLGWNRGLRGGELVLLGQPNNPTGRAFDTEAFCSRRPDMPRRRSSSTRPLPTS